jgi:hypothetical protein
MRLLRLQWGLLLHERATGTLLRHCHALWTRACC